MLAIERSRVEHVAGGSPGDAIRLAGTRRVWSGLGGPGSAGKHVVIGLVDSGIWPENPSFAGVPLDRSTCAAAYPGFTGGCQSGDRWSSNLCDGKVIAARYFVEGFGADRLAPSEFLSPRDAQRPRLAHRRDRCRQRRGRRPRRQSELRPGLGRRTRRGDRGLQGVLGGTGPQRRRVRDPDTARRSTRRSRDGVDVLNYSVSGHDAALTDVVELAFLNAAAAGVFVAAAAGDDGTDDGRSTTPGPWVTTVGASTDDAYQGAVVLGNGRTVYGSMVVESRRSRTHPWCMPVTSRPRPGREDRRPVPDPGRSDAAGRSTAPSCVCDRGVT